MNKELQEFARKKLKEGLVKCTEGELRLFKQMYSYPDISKLKSSLLASIDDVVDFMPEDKLDWAMTQVKNTLKKKE